LLKSDNNFLRNSHNSEHTRMWSFVPRHTACKMQSSEGVKGKQLRTCQPRFCQSRKLSIHEQTRPFYSL